MEADKLRMQSTLQERLKKRREEKLRAKQDELVNNANEARRELDQRQQSQLQRMKADEVNLRCILIGRNMMRCLQHFECW